MDIENKDDLRADMEQVREDLKCLRDDLSKATGSLYESGRQSISTAGQYVRENAVAAKQCMQETINKRPVTCLLVAVGVGVLIGALLRRR